MSFYTRRFAPTNTLYKHRKGALPIRARMKRDAPPQGKHNMSQLSWKGALNRATVVVTQLQPTGFLPIELLRPPAMSYICLVYPLASSKAKKKERQRG